MVAVAGLYAVVFTTTLLSLSGGVEGGARMLARRNTALATTTSTDVTHSQRGETSSQAEDNDLLGMLSSIVKTGTDITVNLLQIIKWPLSVGLDLHSTAISQIGLLITLFNFLVGFVTPDGMGANFLTWLRGNPAKMSRGLPTTPWTDVRYPRFKKLKMEF